GRIRQRHETFEMPESVAASQRVRIEARDDFAFDFIPRLTNPSFQPSTQWTELVGEIPILASRPVATERNRSWLDGFFIVGGAAAVHLVGRALFAILLLFSNTARLPTASLDGRLG